MPLNESLCRKALPREENYKLRDGGGLYLFVQTNGSRYWRMNHREEGKQRTASFGVYPQVSLRASLRKGLPQAAST